jgi:hypothetical protein
MLRIREIALMMALVSGCLFSGSRAAMAQVNPHFDIETCKAEFARELGVQLTYWIHEYASRWNISIDVIRKAQVISNEDISAEVDRSRAALRLAVETALNCRDLTSRSGEALAIEVLRSAGWDR